MGNSAIGKEKTSKRVSCIERTGDDEDHVGWDKPLHFILLFYINKLVFILIFV